MQIEEILLTALRVVDDAELPDDLRAVAFSKVLERLMAEGRGEARSGLPALTTGQTTSQNGSALDRVASGLGVSTEAAGVVYYEEDDDLGIGMAHAKLPKGKAAATRELALLVASGRQAGDFDAGWTKVSEIRKWCEEFGKFDSANFAATIRDMGDAFSFKGQGQQREVRVLRPGFERARQLIEELATMR